MAGHQRIAKDLQNMSVSIEGKQRIVEAYDSSNTTEAVDSNLNLVSHELEALSYACAPLSQPYLKSGGGISLGTKVLPKHDNDGRALTWVCNGFCYGFQGGDRAVDIIPDVLVVE